MEMLRSAIYCLRTGTRRRGFSPGQMIESNGVPHRIKERGTNRLGLTFSSIPGFSLLGLFYYKVLHALNLMRRETPHPRSERHLVSMISTVGIHLKSSRICCSTTVRVHTFA
jgi:hypothetical protein